LAVGVSARDAALAEANLLRSSRHGFATQHRFTKQKAKKRISGSASEICMLALEQVLQLFANMSRTLIAAGVAGALFSSAWWIFIDAFASAQKNNDPQPFLFLFLLPGLFATLGLMLINLVDWSKLSEGQSGFSGEDLTGRSRCFLFTGVLVAFAAFGVSIWIMISSMFSLLCSPDNFFLYLYSFIFRGRRVCQSYQRKFIPRYCDYCINVSHPSECHYHALRSFVHRGLQCVLNRLMTWHG
jgi:hypothetical protein